MIKNLVNLANYLDENGLRTEADYLDSLIEASLKKESGFLRVYAKQWPTAVIIKGNPEYISGHDDFYEEIKEFLEELGYKVSFDKGAPYTVPPKADLWIGHSRGSDRLEGAVPEYAKAVLAIGVPEPDKQPFPAINHPDDDPKMGKKPDDAHFIFTKKMKNKIKDISDEIKDKINKKASINEEAEKELNLDDEWLKEVGIDRDREEKRLKSKEPEPEESFEEKIPTAFDNLDWSARWEMGEHKDSDLKRLKEAGITPVAAEAKTLIGYGSYGRVYNVIWNGKPAVAKVGQKSDGEAWSKILAIRNSLPAQSQRHLGAVYDIIDSPPGSIIVMKKLIPLTSEYNRYWNMGSFKRPIEDFSFPKFEELYNPEELMKWFEAELLLWLPEKFRRIESPSISEIKEESKRVKPKPHSISDLKKIAPSASDLDLFFHFKKGKKDYWKKSLKLSLIKKNKDLIGKAKEAYSPETKQTLDTLSDSLEYYAERYVNNLYDNINISNYITDSFPQNWREDKANTEVHPKLQSFYDMIKQLQGKGIFWSDLKSDNVMLDPYGEELTLVLTDVGNFAMQN